MFGQPRHTPSLDLCLIIALLAGWSSRCMVESGFLERLAMLRAKAATLVPTRLLLPS